MRNEIGQVRAIQTIVIDVLIIKSSLFTNVNVMANGSTV